MTNDWPKHMSEVSDEVIEPYINNWEQYPSAIVEAAVAEMEKRGRPVAPELIEKMQKNFAQRTDVEWNRAQEPQSLDGAQNAEITTDPAAPLFYSRKAIMGFSIFICPFFASFMLAANIERTEQKRGFWLVILLGVLHLCIVYAINSQLEKPITPLVYALNAAGGYLFSQPLWNEVIGKKIQYRKRTLAYPFVAAAGVILILILLFVLARP